MAPTTLNRKTQTFAEPEIVSETESAESDSENLVAGGRNLGEILDESDSDGATEENDSDSDDAPEAESLSGGRAAADARASALKRHEEKLKELRKTKNKAREAFIRSTKPQNESVAEDRGADAGPNSTGDGNEENEEEEEEAVEEAPRSSRLPDSVFAAAHESVERKRSKKPLKKGAPAKRRRLREVPAEKVVNGRTLRVMTGVNAPPGISSSSSTRKAKNSAKGGSAFRRKWKKVDALRAQVRSRSGPSRNFVTIVQ